MSVQVTTVIIVVGIPICPLNDIYSCSSIVSVPQPGSISGVGKEIRYFTAQIECGGSAHGIIGRGFLPFRVVIIDIYHRVGYTVECVDSLRWLALADVGSIFECGSRVVGVSLFVHDRCLHPFWQTEFMVITDSLSIAQYNLTRVGNEVIGNICKEINRGEHYLSGCIGSASSDIVDPYSVCSCSIGAVKECVFSGARIASLHQGVAVTCVGIVAVAEHNVAVAIDCCRHVAAIVELYSVWVRGVGCTLHEAPCAIG